MGRSSSLSHDAAQATYPAEPSASVRTHTHPRVCTPNTNSGRGLFATATLQPSLLDALIQPRKELATLFQLLQNNNFTAKSSNTTKMVINISSAITSITTIVFAVAVLIIVVLAPPSSTRIPGQRRVCSTMVLG